MKSYSVLMSVYAKENASFLRVALESIVSQTIRPQQIVLMCDGPLGDELDKAIAELQKEISCLEVHRLLENHGLGHALQEGVLLCSNEFIMRMDSDDICMPNRAEVQLKLLEHCDITSSAVVEFNEDPNQAISKRELPLSNEEIRKFIKKRSPFNHPATMFRKSIVLAAGNYRSVPFREDYDLWIRMVTHGAVAANTNEPLVKMRIGNGMVERRFTKEAKKGTKMIRKALREYHLINSFEYALYRMADFCVGILPLWAKTWIYRRFLRKKAS